MAQDDLILRYYESEMMYLREAGKEFAQAHPDRAAMLNLDKVSDRDPYVERLFEGFSFLMGKMRQKLDDDLPELTEGLVSLLWPHYLRTIPSLSVIELAPDYQKLKEPEILSKNFEVISQPIGPKQTKCRYRSTRDVELLPLKLNKAQLLHEPDGRSIIRIRFNCGSLSEWSDINIHSLPIYLNADTPISSALHLFLTRYVQHSFIRYSNAFDCNRQPIDLHFSPMGFNPNDRLWPKGEAAFSGYQLLLEYFSFREKFMFLNLMGLDKIQFPEAIEWFELDIVLSKLWSQDLFFSEENFVLYCTPVINLFEIEADPLRVTGLQHEYLLRPLRIQDGHTEIYSVDHVKSSKRNELHDFVPFSSFQHRGGMLRHTAPERYYHTRVRRGASGLYDTWLILGGDAFEKDFDFEEEILSLRITATNGQLPRSALRNTLLNQSLHSTQLDMKVRNLSAPTMPCYPPSTDRFHWRVLSHLSSNFLSMLDNAEILRGTLALYDWTDDEMNRRRLEAIVNVEHSLIQRFEKGFLLRGVDIEVTINSNGFSGEGDICLFGEMLNQFFALYTDIHLFNQLTIILKPTGKSFTWKENHSQKISG